jgi:hypothetical protein
MSWNETQHILTSSVHYYSMKHLGKGRKIILKPLIQENFVLLWENKREKNKNEIKIGIKCLFPQI